MASESGDNRPRPSDGKTSTTDPNDSPTSIAANRDRLESWKDIATFIGHTERTAMRWAKELGMPDMKEDFLYQKIELSAPSAPAEATSFARTLIELPQLIEVMARDNNKSTCVAIDFGAGAAKNGFGRNDYVCADNSAQRLIVKLTNSMLTVNKGAKEYSEPYFEKK